MATSLEIDVSGATQLAAKFDGATAVLQEELTTAMQESVLAVKRPAMEATPVDTGTMRRAWTTTATATEGKISNSASYARYVNDGRSAGAAMPPAGALLGWMSRHGFPADAEFVLRRAISRHGIPAKNIVQKALAQAEPAILQAFRAAEQRFLARMKG